RSGTEVCAYAFRRGQLVRARHFDVGTGERPSSTCGAPGCRQDSIEWRIRLQLEVRWSGRSRSTDCTAVAAVHTSGARSAGRVADVTAAFTFQRPRRTTRLEVRVCKNAD